MRTRSFSLFLPLFLVSMSVANGLPKPSPEKLPLWRGFNLLEKFHLDWNNKPFVEQDFKLMSEWGFNFARLPMDYRVWILDGNWLKFNEAVLKEIDQAVEWGKKYNVHVCLNFHRGPGFTVASPKEATDLWTNAETQKVFALHWATFAKRYKGIPNENLSFDLLNEPTGVSNEGYAKVVQLTVEAIRKEDPARLVICDSNDYGNTPVPELIPLKVAQMTRGYAPFQLTHYGAGWVGNNKDWPVPVWPIASGLQAMFYGSGKPEFQSPLVLSFPSPSPLPGGEGSTLTLRVGKVSSKATLVVRADGKEIFKRVLEPKVGAGEWKSSEFQQEWKIVHAVYDMDLKTSIPAGTKEIQVENTDGDWMTLTRLEIKTGPANALVLNTVENWGSKQGSFSVTPDGKLQNADGSLADGATQLWKNQIEPFKKLEAMGSGVHVGEWGTYNKTPHAVSLAWMKDCLKNWKKAGWGWALWNFRGSFGIMDSERTDVAYEEFQGHKLDREMLKLLQSY